MEEGDFSEGRELSVIIVTSLGIFKKTVESIKEIKKTYNYVFTLVPNIINLYC